MFLFDSSTNFVQTKLIINLLKKEVPTIERVLLIQRQIRPGTELDIKSSMFLLFGFIHFSNFFFRPFFSICNAIGFADIFFRPQPFDHL